MFDDAFPIRSETMTARQRWAILIYRLTQGVFVGGELVASFAMKPAQAEHRSP